MIDLENKEERNKLIDDFFNKGYACDIREVYQAIVNTVADLEYEDVKKTKEIERLNNIINEAKEFIGHNYFVVGRIEKIYKILDKGSDKE